MLGSVAPARFAIRVIGALALVGAASACGSGGAVPTCVSGSAGCTSILFLGNSYTYVNDLPATFARLSDSGGHRVNAQMVANGGETLAQHAAAKESLDRIAAGGWSYVVLQEQSQTPATDSGRDQMAAAAQTLSRAAGAKGTPALLFMTPAHRDGMPEASLPDYASMQRAIDDAYLDVGRRLGLGSVPAGYVWFMVHQKHPGLSLWQDDGSHPSVAGTYLEACVFYDSIFRQPAAGLAFIDGLPDDEARALQQAADDNVLSSLSDWGLPS